MVLFMNCIKILTDEDFSLNSIPFNNPRLRYGARGLVFDKDGYIAILHKRNKNEYKLVGGGIENNEEPEETFKREVLEEAGVSLKNIKFIGTIEEHKSLDNFKQISYVYVANVDNYNVINFTQEEINEGSELLWLSIEEALNLIHNCEEKLIAPEYETIYHNKFIVRRDYEILKFYKDNYIK